MRILPQKPQKSLISLTALIDVVFILLVFFMLASKFTDWRAIEMITAGKGKAVASPKAALVLAVLPDNRVTLQGQTLTMTTLPATLAGVAKTDSDRPLAVQPHSGVPLQPVVSVMEAAKQAGFTRISLIKSATGRP